MSPGGEFVRVPATLVDAGISDEAMGFVLRAIRLAWQRGMTRQRSPNYGQPIPLSRQDLLALTKRGRVDHARAFLAQLPPLAVGYLGASWSLGGELAGVLGRGKCPALKVSAARVSAESPSPSLLPPAQRGGRTPPQRNAQGCSSAPPSKREQEQTHVRHASEGPTHLRAALREVLGA